MSEFDNNIGFDKYRIDVNKLLSSYSTKQFLLNYVSDVIGINVTESDIQYLLDEWTMYLYDITSNERDKRLYAGCDSLVRETLKNVSRM